jgi:hypothetical protein
LIFESLSNFFGRAGAEERIPSISIIKIKKIVVKAFKQSD